MSAAIYRISGNEKVLEFSHAVYLAIWTFQRKTGLLFTVQSPMNELRAHHSNLQSDLSSNLKYPATYKNAITKQSFILQST